MCDHCATWDQVICGFSMLCPEIEKRKSHVKKRWTCQLNVKGKKKTNESNDNESGVKSHEAKGIMQKESHGIKFAWMSMMKKWIIRKDSHKRENKSCKKNHMRETNRVWTKMRSNKSREKIHLLK